MKHNGSADLLQEMERYLTLVDLLRAEGREPRWRTDYESERAACLASERSLVDRRRQT
jgi:hypothetical protein